jgi:hypothetical protein
MPVCGKAHLPLSSLCSKASKLRSSIQQFNNNEACQVSPAGFFCGVSLIMMHLAAISGLTPYLIVNAPLNGCDAYANLHMNCLLGA